MITGIDKIIPFEFFSYLTLLLGIRISKYTKAINLSVNIYQSCSEFFEANGVPAVSCETRIITKVQ